MKKKSYEYIYQKYIIENKTVKEMTEDIGIHRDTFYAWLRKFSIKKIDSTRILTEKDKVKDKEWLTEQFKTKSAKKIAESLGISDGRVEYWLKKYNIKQRFKYPINESKVSVSDPVFCYWAGLVATDGHLDKNTDRVTVSLVEDSEDVLGFIAEYFEYGGNVYKHKGRCTLCLSSTKMISELSRLGIDKYSEKTFDLVTPKSFYSDECKRLYIRGCLDGDGSIKKTTGVVRLFCGAEKFIDGVVNIIQSKGIDIEKTYHNKKYPGFELRRIPSLQLLSWVYQGFDKCRLTRKFSIALEVWGDDIVRAISMEKI